jgi:hypothetical protein
MKCCSSIWGLCERELSDTMVDAVAVEEEVEEVDEKEDKDR